MTAPKELRVSKDRKLLTVTFPGHQPFELPAEFLRVVSLHELATLCSFAVGKSAGREFKFNPYQSKFPRQWRGNLLW